MLNSSIYLINHCWRDFKVSVEPTIYEPIIMMMRDDVIKIRKFLFIWIVIVSVYLINLCWHELLGFCGTNQVIYGPKITLIRRDLPQYVKIYYFYCKKVWWMVQKILFLRDIFPLIHPYSLTDITPHIINKPWIRRTNEKP